MACQCCGGGCDTYCINGFGTEFCDGNPFLYKWAGPGSCQCVAEEECLEPGEGVDAGSAGTFVQAFDGDGINGQCDASTIIPPELWSALPRGACCSSQGYCFEVTHWTCIYGFSGTYAGDGTTCPGFNGPLECSEVLPCENPFP